MRDTVADRASTGQRSTVARAIACACAPDNRTIDSAPRPGAVACATIVSDKSRTLSVPGPVTVSGCLRRLHFEGFTGLDDAHR